MKLLLTSGGLTNKTIVAALQELVGKPFEDAKLVFVPTAANMEAGDKGWLIDDLQNCKKLGFQEVDIVDIVAMPREIWQPRLENANVLLFGGGITSYLMKTIRESGLEDMLPKLLETRVYVGISAGSIVTGPYLSLGEIENLYDDGQAPDESEKGMNWVPFRIAPHLNSPYFPKYSEESLDKISTSIKSTLYAIDDDTAIKVVDSEIEVISEGKWKKYN